MVHKISQISGRKVDITDFPTFSDTVYSNTPLTVTLLACPKWLVCYWLPLVTVTIWLQWHFSHVPMVSLWAGKTVLHRYRATFASFKDPFKSHKFSKSLLAWTKRPENGCRRTEEEEGRKKARLPYGYHRILRIVCVWPFGLLDYGSATLRCKIWSLPFLGLHPTPSTLAQSKERKGSNFAIWQPWKKATCTPLRCAKDTMSRGGWDVSFRLIGWWQIFIISTIFSKVTQC